MKRDRQIQEILDPVTEVNFVKHGRAAAEIPEDRQAAEAPRQQDSPQQPEPKRMAISTRRAKSAAVMPPGLIPVNVRVRPEIAAALQTGSLERQLQGIEPSSKREIVEQALEPWLRQHGYLPQPIRRFTQYSRNRHAKQPAPAQLPFHGRSLRYGETRWDPAPFAAAPAVGCWGAEGLRSRSATRFVLPSGPFPAPVAPSLFPLRETTSLRPPYKTSGKGVDELFAD
jgi:hypothetical protein